MGGSQSARRLSIENNTGGSSIQISDAVVERLKSSDDCDEEKIHSAVRSQPRVKIDNKYSPDESIQHFNHINHPFMTTLQMKQELENELRKNNEYWENRVKTLASQQEEMNKIIETEYMKAVDEMEKKMPKPTPKSKDPPCSLDKSKVISCYLANGQKSLLCADEVLLFTRCMSNYMVNLNKSEDDVPC